jgi:hypothetical protein
MTLTQGEGKEKGTNTLIQGVLVLRELNIRCFAYTRFYPKEVFLHRLQYYKVACARWVADLSFAF